LGILDKKDNGVSQLLGTKYGWAKDLHKESVAVDWNPQHIPSNVDKQQWEAKDVLTDSERNLVYRTLGLFSAGESLVSNSASFVESQYITEGALRHYLARKTYEECLSSDHEVLTSKGWVKIEDVTLDHLVFSYNEKTKSLVLDKVNRTISYVDKNVFEFKSPLGSIYATAGHRHYLSNAAELKNKKKNNQFFTTLDEVEEESYLVKTSDEWDVSGLLHPVHSLNIEKGAVRPSVESYKALYRILLNNQPLKNVGAVPTPHFNILSTQELLNKLSTSENELQENKFVISNYSETYEQALASLSKLSSKGIKSVLNKCKIYSETLDNSSEALSILEMLHVISGTKIVREDNSLKPYRSVIKTSKKELPVLQTVHCLSTNNGNFITRTIGNKSCVVLTGNSIHATTAEVCCEWYSLPEDEVAAAYKNIPSIKAMENFVMKSMSNFDNAVDIKDPININKFIKNMFTIYMVVEGMWFISNFIAILALKRRNILPGLGQQILYTWRDEEHHINFGVEVLKILKSEYPDAYPSNEELFAIMDEALEIGRDYNLDLLKDPINGLSVTDLNAFQQYLANKNLLKLGMDLRYPTIEIPINWLHEVTGDVLTAFFEQKEVNYKSVAALDDDY
jgi:ribonucleotide reductase beta subunit family protein with ferritin-like domain/uncharacterized Fe-S cluster-containing protein